MLKEMKRIQQVVRWAASNSCEMSDSVNLSGICLLTQLYNLPLLSVITASSYTETRVVSGNAFICLCVLLFIWCYTDGGRTSVCECFCPFMCEDLCKGSLFLHMNPLWRHTTRANENAASRRHTRTALELTSHTYSSVSVILRGSLIPVFTPSCEI